MEKGEIMSPQERNLVSELAAGETMQLYKIGSTGEYFAVVGEKIAPLRKEIGERAENIQKLASTLIDSSGVGDSFCSIDSSGEARVIPAFEATEALKLQQKFLGSSGGGDLLALFYAQSMHSSTQTKNTAAAQTVWTGEGDVREGDIVEARNSDKGTITLFAEEGSDAANLVLRGRKNDGDTMLRGLEALCGKGAKGILGPMGVGLAGVYVKVAGKKANGCSVYRHSAHPPDNPGDQDKYIWCDPNGEWVVGWYQNLDTDVGYIRIQGTGSEDINPEELELQEHRWRVYDYEESRGAGSPRFKSLGGLRAESGAWLLCTVHEVRRNAKGAPAALVVGRDTSYDKSLPEGVAAQPLEIGLPRHRVQLAWNFYGDSVGWKVGTSQQAEVSELLVHWMLDDGNENLLTRITQAALPHSHDVPSDGVVSTSELRVLRVDDIALNTSGERKCRRPAPLFVGLAQGTIAVPTARRTVSVQVEDEARSLRQEVNESMGWEATVAAHVQARVLNRYRSTFQLPACMWRLQLPAQRVAVTRTIMQIIGAESLEGGDLTASVAVRGLIETAVNPAEFRPPPAGEGGVLSKNCMQAVLHTGGGGNCLFNAVSINMWGVNDYEFKKAAGVGAGAGADAGSLSGLRAHFNRKYKGNSALLQQVRLRWVAERERCQAVLPEGMKDKVGEANSNEEWKHLMDMLQFDNHQGNMNQRMSESLHIFMLASMLQRPICVYAEQTNSLTDGCYEGIDGLYLPLLCDPTVCHKVPLTLLYIASDRHFSAIVGVQGLTTRVPLFTKAGPLVLRFSSRDQAQEEWSELAGGNGMNTSSTCTLSCFNLNDIALSAGQYLSLASYDFGRRFAQTEAPEVLPRVETLRTQYVCQLYSELQIEENALESAGEGVRIVGVQDDSMDKEDEDEMMEEAIRLSMNPPPASRSSSQNSARFSLDDEDEEDEDEMVEEAIRLSMGDEAEMERPAKALSMDATPEEDEDEMMEEAIRLSMGPPPASRSSSQNSARFSLEDEDEEDEDEMMKEAIRLSMRPPPASRSSSQNSARFSLDDEDEEMMVQSEMSNV